MTRNLYVILGTHYPLDTTEEIDMQEFYRLVSLRLNLIMAIGMKVRVTHFFSDSMTQGMANEYNEAMDTLMEMDEELAEKESESLLSRLSKHQSLHEEAGSFKIWYQLRKRGIPMRAYQTERPDFGNSRKLIREYADANGWNDQEIEDTLNLDFSDSDVYTDPELEGLAEICSDIRDSAIFRNVVDHTGLNGVLFMGNSHRLKEFKDGEHDLNVYQLTIDDRLIVTGTLPEDLKPEMQWVHRKFPDANFRIEYQIRR